MGNYLVQDKLYSKMHLKKEQGVDKMLPGL